MRPAGPVQFGHANEEQASSPRFLSLDSNGRDRDRVLCFLPLAGMFSNHSRERKPAAGKQEAK
jgi:hypothetical protein